MKKPIPKGQSVAITCDNTNEVKTAIVRLTSEGYTPVAWHVEVMNGDKCVVVFHDNTFCGHTSFDADMQISFVDFMNGGEPTVTPTTEHWYTSVQSAEH